MVRAVDNPPDNGRVLFRAGLPMANNGKDFDPGRSSLTPEERDALKRRASEIGKRLDEVHARKAPPPEDARSRGNALGQAYKILAELIVGVVVGTGLGWALDKQLGTSPWLMIVLLIVGFAAGISNVIRTARRMQAEAEPLQRGAQSVAEQADADSDDDDDAPAKERPLSPDRRSR
jgi:ATP synthase protein I